jgi:hypothetical protein
VDTPTSTNTLHPQNSGEKKKFNLEQFSWNKVGILGFLSYKYKEVHKNANFLVLFVITPG